MPPTILIRTILLRSDSQRNGSSLMNQRRAQRASPARRAEARPDSPEGLSYFLFVVLLRTGGAQGVTFKPSILSFSASIVSMNGSLVNDFGTPFHSMV